MSSYFSNSFTMLERSAEFLWAKQAAHLDNISNAETPRYKVKTVTFEEEFNRRLKAVAGPGVVRDKGVIRDTIESTPWEVWEDEESTRLDENGVNITEQFTEAVRTAYQLQYVYHSISSDLGMLSKAANA